MWRPAVFVGAEQQVCVSGNEQSMGCSSRRAGWRQAAGRFSLLEILLVLGILSLVLAVILPRVGRLPRRLAVENALSSIRLAVVEVGMRARASGTPLGLVLDPDESCFLVSALPRSFAAHGGGPGGGESGVSAGDDAAAGQLLSSLSRYAIPAEVSWQLDTLDRTAAVDPEGRPMYSFFPGGEATGPRMIFTIAGRTFELDIDRLTGRPVIRDLDAG